MQCEAIPTCTAPVAYVQHVEVWPGQISGPTKTRERYLCAHHTEQLRKIAAEMRGPEPVLTAYVAPVHHMQMRGH